MFDLFFSRNINLLSFRFSFSSMAYFSASLRIMPERWLYSESFDYAVDRLWALLSMVGNINFWGVPVTFYVACDDITLLGCDSDASPSSNSSEFSNLSRERERSPAFLVNLSAASSLSLNSSTTQKRSITGFLL